MAVGNRIPHNRPPALNPELEQRLKEAAADYKDARDRVERTRAELGKLVRYAGNLGHSRPQLSEVTGFSVNLMQKLTVGHIDD